jgi:hypothetical protein
LITIVACEICEPLSTLRLLSIEHEASFINNELASIWKQRCKDRWNDDTNDVAVDDVVDGINQTEKARQRLVTAMLNDATLSGAIALCDDKERELYCLASNMVHTHTYDILKKLKYHHLM